MSAGDGSGDLLSVARALCDHPVEGFEGRWPRAVAILTRGALEESLDRYWSARSEAIADCGAQRAKMLCLPSYTEDPAVAHEAYQLWATLSGACHRHAYDIDPTVEELLRWIDAVERVREVLVA